MSSTAYAPNRVVALSGGGADSLLHAERLRIARELHDVVAHSFAAIALHAGVAEHVKDDRPEQVGEALRAIKAVSSEASRELRAILGVLRSVDDGPSTVATRGVGGLDALAASARLQIEVLGRDRAVVGLEGHRALTLSRRQSEVLVLLGASTSGLSGEQLAIALYGDEGNPLSARAEVSRLRRAVGKSILAEPYRLQAGVDCDIGQLRLLLCDGRTAAALDAYRGPLLPRSDAPGVVALRNEIDDWVRRAVLTSDDLEVLWRWLSTPSGEGDVQAWRRFLANVSADDGRRCLAATRLQRLRDGAGVYGPADHRLVAAAS